MQSKVKHIEEEERRTHTQTHNMKIHQHIHKHIYGHTYTRPHTHPYTPILIKVARDLQYQVSP